MNTIKVHNLNNQFPKNEINVVCTFEILSVKVEFLTQFNVAKYGKTGIEYIELMTYAVGSLILKSILSCSTVYVIKHFISTERSISSKMDKPWSTLGVYSSKTMHQICSFLIVHDYVTRGHYTVGHILSPKLIGFAELHF